MFRYTIKRLLIFIPTLITISLLIFIISINAPGDPVETILNQHVRNQKNLSGEKEYKKLRHQLGLDLPLFYFYFTNATYPDTLYRFTKKRDRKNLKRMSYEFGEWNNVFSYYRNLKILENKIFELKSSSNTPINLERIVDNINLLYNNYDEKKLNSSINDIQLEILKSKKNNIPVDYENEYLQLKNTFNKMITQTNIINRYIPTIHWYGINNQYHNWLFGFLVGDYGISYQDKRSVSTKIFNSLKWSLILSSLSIIITYLVAIPLGIISATSRNSITDKLITTFLFLLYSLPNFWIATMLIQYLGSGGLGWFPTFGLGNLPQTAPLIDRFWETTYHLILPVFCLTYTSFAFISRQMRGAMVNTLEMNYIKTAQAKGLKNRAIIWKHAFKNSLLPIVTLFANVFPLAISGSFIIEVIFSIPGMGQLSLNAIYARDFPVVFTVLMFTVILTLTGNLIADIIYTYIDPRISFSNKKN